MHKLIICCVRFYIMNNSHVLQGPSHGTVKWTVLLLVIISCQEVMLLSLLFSLLVSLLVRKTTKLLNRFSQNSVERCHWATEETTRFWWLNSFCLIMLTNEQINKCKRKQDILAWGIICLSSGDFCLIGIRVLLWCWRHYDVFGTICLLGMVAES